MPVIHLSCENEMTLNVNGVEHQRAIRREQASNRKEEVISDTWFATSYIYPGLNTKKRLYKHDFRLILRELNHEIMKVKENESLCILILTFIRNVIFAFSNYLNAI